MQAASGADGGAPLQPPMMAGGGATSFSGGGATSFGGGDFGGSSGHHRGELRYCTQKNSTGGDAADFTSCAVEYLTRGAWEEDIAFRGRRRALRCHPLMLREYCLPFLSTGVGECLAGHCASTASSRSSNVVFTCCQWSPEGRCLVAGNVFGELTVWSGTSFAFQDLKRVPTTAGAVTALRWSHDGRALYSSDAGGNVHVSAANLAPVTVLREMQGHPVIGLATSPTDLKLVACGMNVDPIIWDIRMSTKERTLAEKGYDTSSLDWHHSKSLICCGAASGAIHYWDPRIAKTIHTANAHRSPVLTVRFSPCQRYLLSAGKDGKTHFWDIRNLKGFATASGGEGVEIGAADWNPMKPQLVALGDNFGTLTYWDINDASCGDGLGTPSIPRPRVEVVGAHSNAPVYSVSWHASGHAISSVGADTYLRFWSRLRPGVEVPVTEATSSDMNPNEQRSEMAVLGDVRCRTSVLLDRIYADATQRSRSKR